LELSKFKHSKLHTDKQKHISGAESGNLAKRHMCRFNGTPRKNLSYI